MLTPVIFSLSHMYVDRLIVDRWIVEIRPSVDSLNFAAGSCYGSYCNLRLWLLSVVVQFFRASILKI